MLLSSPLNIENYLIGEISTEKCRKWGGLEKRKKRLGEVGHIGGLSIESGVQTFCTLWCGL